jgi:hypothetical protein
MSDKPEVKRIARYLRVKPKDLMDADITLKIAEKLQEMMKPESEEWPIHGDMTLRDVHNLDGSHTVIMELEVMR